MIDLTNIYIHGRYSYDNDLILYNTASGIEFNFKGNSFVLDVKSSIGPQKDQAWMRIIIDNDYENGLDYKIEAQNQKIKVECQQINAKHNVKVLKVSEAIESHLIISDLSLNGSFLDKPIYDNLFFVIGDSTVAGFGNLGHLGDEKQLFDTDGLNGFIYLAVKAYNATMYSLNGSGWGLSFSRWTNPMRKPLLKYYHKVAPLENINCSFDNISPTIIIISLGTNDLSYIEFDHSLEEKNRLINEFKNDYNLLLNKLGSDFPKVPIIMVYGAMREKNNYQNMHDIYLNNKDKYPLYELVLDGDCLGVSNHPTINSHLEMSKKLIKLIGDIKND